ncbi:aminoglycoside phosphotransferase [Streptomyces sp. CBMA156]|uniref:aminoglycoside phosphotransferase n=1 Tax=Streptomyces sp. CBMA156 TaxID=1930280 RepID=UPI001661FCA9|nr:aminoglycoside phosphotransferase [Streptomyces sp. CBMA156]
MWSGLPKQLRSAVEAACGPVLTATEATAGRTAWRRLSLEIPGGLVFLKATPLSHRHCHTLDTEARVAAAVRTLAPRLLYHGAAADWRWLVFEHVQGRAADLSPGAADLGAVARVLRHLAVLPAPDAALLRVEDRWEYLGADLDLGLLAGDRLVHTDLNAGNILIRPDGTAVLVDWAWPGRGAGWLSAAFLLAQLIDAGTSPADAENWAWQVLPDWAAAPTDAVDTFVTALTRRRAAQAATCSPARRTEREGQLRTATAWNRFRSRS